MSRFDEKDSDNHPREQEPAFNRLIEAGLSRRGFLKGVGAASMVAFFAASPVAQAVAAATRPLLGFQAVPASVADTIVVPPGYKAEVLIAWGDALFPDAPAFAQGNDAKAQARQFGDNNDGMSFFSLGPDRALLAVNNEYTNYEYLFEDGGKTLSAEAVAKAQAAHGVSLVELVRVDGKWQANPKGALNRRITATTPMTLSGPAAGHALLKTQADPEGRTALGTFNNCANGQTPWGTYLTCEENFNGYFGSEGKPVLDPRAARYGLAAEDAGFGWHKFDERFDLAKHPQEPHRFGWVVEIDPRDPASTPKKRTALGRFKHENAAFTVNQDGRAVVYLGDDERGSTSTASSRRTRWRRAMTPPTGICWTRAPSMWPASRPGRGAQGHRPVAAPGARRAWSDPGERLRRSGRCSSSPGRRRPGSAPPPWIGPSGWPCIPTGPRSTAP